MAHGIVLLKLSEHMWNMCCKLEWCFLLPKLQKKGATACLALWSTQVQQFVLNVVVGLLTNVVFVVVVVLLLGPLFDVVLVVLLLTWRCCCMVIILLDDLVVVVLLLDDLVIFAWLLDGVGVFLLLDGIVVILVLLLDGVVVILFLLLFVYWLTDQLKGCTTTSNRTVLQGVNAVLM